MIRLTALFLVLLPNGVLADSAEELPMPTLEVVGPAAMPAGIAPLYAPFEIPRLQRPKFAERSISIVEAGAKAGLKQLVTASIQRSIDDLSKNGGGTVLVPKGKWLTGRIELKSNVNLHLEEGAELHFSGAIEDYLPPVFTRCECLEAMGLGGLIYANNQSNIAVTGKGLLIGPADGPVREIREGLTDDIVDHRLPVEQRIFDGQEGRHFFRPYFISPINCRNVLIEGVSLRNGPSWNVVPIYCEQVIVRGVQVASQGVVNGDGINLDSCRNVLIEYCSVATGDDCYTMKAGRNEDGLRIGKPTENVVMRFCHSNGGFGGIAFGSDTAGVLRNIYVHDCVFNNVRHAAYFKTRRPRAGGGEHILVERVAFDAYHHAIMFDMLGAPIFVGELAKRLPRLPVTELTPFYRDVALRRFVGTSEKQALKIKGIPESPATRITLEQADIKSQGLIYLADVEDVKITNSRFAASSPEIYLLDARRVHLENVDFTPGKQPLRVSADGPGTKAISFRDCSPAFEDYEIETSDGAESKEISGSATR